MRSPPLESSESTNFRIWEADPVRSDFNASNPPGPFSLTQVISLSWATCACKLLPP